MSLIHYLGGYRHKASPIRNGAGDFLAVGDTWFVDSGHAEAADDPSHGQSPDYPFATIDYAISRTTASNGDVIFLAPGHAETVANATTFLVDVAGLAIIGMGHGSTRPTFTMSATASSIEIDAANTYLSNIRIVPSIADVVVGLNVDADNVTLDNVAFELGSTTNLGFDMMIDATAVDYVTITNCSFLTYVGETTNAPARAIKIDDSDYSKIVGNFFFGDWATAIIHNSTDTTEGAPTCVNLTIADNVMTNRVTTDTTAVMVRLVNACTGLFAFNRMGSATAQIQNTFDLGSLISIENYSGTFVDESGILVPPRSTET